MVVSNAIISIIIDNITFHYCFKNNHLLPLYRLAVLAYLAGTSSKKWMIFQEQFYCR